MDTIPETIHKPGPANGKPVEMTPHLLDWQWVFAQREAAPSPFGCYRGLFVAILDKQVVGAAPPGPLAGDLAERVAERFHVSADRPVVTYVEGAE